MTQDQEREADPNNPGWCIGCTPDDCIGCGIGLPTPRQPRASLAQPASVPAVVTPEMARAFSAALEPGGWEAAPETQRQEVIENLLPALAAMLAAAPQAPQPAQAAQALAVAPESASQALKRGKLAEAVARAIAFADSGSSEDWAGCMDLAEAAIRVCDARNPPRCSYCHAATSRPVAAPSAQAEQAASKPPVQGSQS